MYLEQGTMFGVRGERFRIGKRSPFAKAEAADARRPTLDAQRPKENGGAGKCDGCLRVGVVNCLACAEAEGASDGRSGEASGCGVVLLLAAAIACCALACAIERRGVRVHVEWAHEYPDPVCERCGKVLDGTHGACVEEGRQ